MLHRHRFAMFAARVGGGQVTTEDPAAGPLPPGSSRGEVPFGAAFWESELDDGGKYPSHRVHNAGQHESSSTESGTLTGDTQDA